jgi:hypothetical protein
MEQTSKPKKPLSIPRWLPPALLPFPWIALIVTHSNQGLACLFGVIALASTLIFLALTFSPTTVRKTATVQAPALAAPALPPDPLPRNFPRTLSDVLYKLTHEDFELFAAAIVKVYKGYEFERHSGKTGDRGVDVHMKNQLGLPVIVQAKHYSTTSVGSPDMQKFGGALLQHRPVRAVFVTSSYFSSEAKHFIRSDSRIETIDGRQIATLLESPTHARAIAEAYADIKEKKRRAG